MKTKTLILSEARELRLDSTANSSRNAAAWRSVVSGEAAADNHPRHGPADPRRVARCRCRGAMG